MFTFGERTNSPNSDAKSVWHDCSNASAAGACDDPNSIILGYYNYDDGRNSARFHYTLNGVDAACIGTTPHSGTTPSVRMLMEFQINGPVIQNNRGWSIGADAGPGAQYPPTDFLGFTSVPMILMMMIGTYGMLKPSTCSIPRPEGPSLQPTMGPVSDQIGGIFHWMELCVQDNLAFIISMTDTEQTSQWRLQIFQKRIGTATMT